MWRLQIDFIVGSLDTICERKRSKEVSLWTRVSEHTHRGCSGSPCPVSRQRHSCVGCAAAPGRPSLGVSEPSALLLATADLQVKTGNVNQQLPALSAVWTSNTLRVFLSAYVKNSVRVGNHQETEGR